MFYGQIQGQAHGKILNQMRRHQRWMIAELYSYIIYLLVLQGETAAAERLEASVHS